MYKTAAFVLLLTLAASLTPATVSAGPGSGSGAVTGAGGLYSSSVPVNTSHKWYVIYTAEENFSGGRLRFEIPVGWTAPQDVSSSAPGYVTVEVTVDSLVDAYISDVNGRFVEVMVDTIGKVAANWEGVRLVYGDDRNNPNALATSPLTPRTSVFRIYSHPTSQVDEPVEITVMPDQVIDVTPDVPGGLVIAPQDTTVIAGDDIAYSVGLTDAYGNTSWFGSDNTFALEAPEGSFYATYPGPTIDSVVVAAGDSTFQFVYRSIVSGTHTITVRGVTTPTVVDSTTIDVTPVGISKLEFTTGPFTFTADSEGGPYVVEMQDLYGNPTPYLSDQQIDLTSSSGTGAFSLLGGLDFSPVDSLVIPMGETFGQFYYRDTSPGTPTITATATGQGWTVAQQQQTVDAGPPARFLIQPSDTTVTAGDFVRYKFMVVDGVDNPQQVSQTRTLLLSTPSGAFYQTSNHSTPITSIMMPAGEESLLVDLQGQAAVSGVIFVSTIIDGLNPVLTGITNLTVVPGAIDAANSTVDATTNIVANGTDQSQVTVTVRDSYSNPIPGVTPVDLTVDGNAAELDPISSTDINGVTTGYVTDETAEVVTVSATAGGVPLTDTASITFIAGTVDPDSSSIAADTPVIADGVSASSIVVTARDANGNPVQGASVTLSVTPSADAVLDQPGGLTNALGQATGSLRSTKTGPREVRATINGVVDVTDSVVVEFAPGAVASFEWTVNTPSTQAGVFASATLVAKDAQANIVTNYTGTVDLSTTSTGVGDAVVEWAAPLANGTLTQGSGDQATYEFALADSGSADLRVVDIKAEPIELIAEDGAASGTSSTIDVSHTVANQIAIVAGNGQTATVNTAVSTPPRVVVTDPYGNLVDGETVTFTAVGGGGSVDVIAGGGVDSTAATDANGEVQCDVWTLGTGAGPNTLRAKISSGVTPSVDFTATGDPDVGATLVIAPASKSVTVNSVTPVTATLLDQHGNAVSGERVDIFIQATANGTLANDPSNPTTQTTPTSRWGYTNASGQIAVFYNAPSTAGLSDNVDAYTALIPQGNVTDAVYTTTASGATDLRITFVGGNTAVAGSSFEFVVEAIDGNQNVDTGNSSVVDLSAEVGSGIQFSETDFGVPVTQVTLSAGTKTVFGLGNAVGDWDITAQDNAATLGGDTKEVIVQAEGAVHHYTVITSVDTVTAGQTFNVTVQARDQFDNLIADAANSVDLVAVDATTENPETVQLLVGQATLVAGQAVVGETYTLAKDIKVQVTDGSATGISGTLTVQAAGPHSLEYVSGDATGLVAGSPQPLVARVVDSFDNPVEDEPVSYLVTGGGGNVAPNPAPSGSDGQVTVTLNTGMLAGDNGVRASILGGTLERERVSYTVSTVAGAIDTLKVLMSKTSMTAGETIDVTVSAYDANDNLVELDNTTLIDFMPTSGNVTLGATTVQLSGGTATTTVDNTVADPTPFRIYAQVQGGGPDGLGPPVTVVNAVAYQIIKISGDTTGVTVGATRDLEVEVQDEFGNAVPDETVRFLLNPPGGPDGTATLAGGGFIPTDAFGRAVETLNTAATAGDHFVDASIAGVPPGPRQVTFTVTTVAGGIAYYTVSTDVSEQTAGVDVNLTVRAYDGADNLVVGDNTTVVALSLAPPVGGETWGINPATLQAGTLMTTVNIDTANTYQIHAETQGSPGIFGDSGPLTIFPDVPFGVLTATAVPDTITADGSATTTFTSSIVRDQFSNQVPAGELITVGPTTGTVVSADASGLPGVQRAVQADGRITFQLRSSTLPGTETVGMASVNGSAAGTANVEFAARPNVVATGAPIPGTVVLGSSVAFVVPVENQSATRVNLGTGTTFEFDDGTTFFSAALTVPKSLPAGAVSTLQFVSTQVPLAMLPARYRPTIQLTGIDEYGQSYSDAAQLPAASLLVSSIQITAVSPDRINVSRGATDTVRVTVENKTPETVTIQVVTLNFKAGVDGKVGTYIQGASPDLNPTMDIPAYTSLPIRVPVTVNEFSETGLDSIDAQVTGVVNGNTVQDLSLAPIPLPTWTVQEAAAIAYVPLSLSPMTVSSGKQYSMAVTLENQGQAPAIIDTANTSLSFTDGGNTYSVHPAQNVAIAGGATQQITFKAKHVPAAFTPGSYDVTIDVSGTENGSPFNQVLTTAQGVDLIGVVTAADVTREDGTLAPTTVSKGASVAFQIQVRNNGGATVELDPAQTTFSFDGGNYTATLNEFVNTTIAPSGLSTLEFNGVVVDNSIASGPYNPDIVLVGTENDLEFSTSFSLNDAVNVQDAADLSIQSITPSQDKITANQVNTIQVVMEVQNNGQATVQLDTTNIRFVVGGSDRTGEFAITVPTQFDGGPTLGGGQTDFLTFTVKHNNPVTSAVMTIEGELEVTDLNTMLPVTANTNLGGKGSLVVQSPADLIVQSITPTQDPVTQGQTKQFEIKMVVRNDGESDVRLAMSSDSTYVDFSAGGATWVWNLSPTLEEGGDVLGEDEAGTVVATVTQVGDATGPIVIDGLVQGEELNSGRNEVSSGGAGLGSIEVQSPAQLLVTSVQPTRPTVTDGTNVPWKIVVDVQNSGGSDLDLVLPDSVTVAFQDENLPSTLVKPSALVGGGTVLGVGASGQLEVLVTQTGTFAGLGPKAITVRVAGQESNTDRYEGEQGTGSVTIQQTATANYVSETLDPDTVAVGSVAQFKLVIENQSADNATMRLDRALTRLRFDGGLYQAALSASSEDSILGGDARLLTFEPEQVDQSIPLGAKTVQVELHWEENGATKTQTVTLPAGALWVQEAGDLQIVEIVSSQPTVTVAQSRPWQITMIVRNNGQSDVDLIFDAAKTFLTFDPLIGAPVTDEYSIGQPSGLKSAGGNRLAGMGTQDSLVFQVTPRFDASTIGPIKVSGMVTGTDAISLVEVSDNTLDGGGGSFEVQTRSVFDMVSIAPEQTTATAGQTKKYQIAIGLENTGGSAVQLDLSPGNTRLIFQAGFDVGWAYTVQDTLLEGGTIVGGGETGTVILTVDTTGTRADITSLRAFVPGIEINSGRIDDASTGLPLTAIDVQDPGVLSISSVAVSQPSVTEDTDKHWVVTARVSNTGEAELEIVPANLGLGIADNTAGTTVIDSPDEFETGGVSLPGGTYNRELSFEIIHTGTFSSLGPKGITVDVEAFEVNTDDPRSDTDNTGTVLVQSPPNLQYVVPSLDPQLISQGAQVGFELEIQNVGANSATARLEPASVFSIFGTSYVTPLVGINDSIPGNSSLVLSFESDAVDIAPNTYPVQVDLDYTHNGNDDSAVINPSDAVTVQTAPDLTILSITPSQPRFTADQSRPIDMVMAVRNNGQATVQFNTANIRFFLGGSNKTSEFTITNPTQFDGGLTLGGGQTDSLRFTVQDNGSNQMSNGLMTVEGDLEVIDLNTMLPVTANTNLGGKGSLVVQSPADLVVESITPLQNPVTRSQTKAFLIKTVVRNGGESDVRLKMSKDSTYVSFSAGGASWNWEPLPTLEGGGVILPGGETGTIVDTVLQVGDIVGPITIDGFVQGEELNSGRNEESRDGDGLGSIVVQSRAQLVVSNVQPTRPTVTEGSNVPWKVVMSVQNTGQSALDLVLPDSVTVAFQDETLPSTATLALPTTMVGGGTVLGGGESRQLEIGVTQTGMFESLGNKAITVRVAGMETNTGRYVGDTDSNGSVRIQETATANYVANTLSPDTVSTGSTVGFQIAVVNLSDSSATMRLDRAQTRLSFESGQYQATLAASSQDSIPGGQFRFLTFESEVVSQSITPGAKTVQVELHWEENGATKMQSVTLPSGALWVQEAGDLQIVAIESSQPTVTVAQSRPWQITMIVRNNGQSDVDLIFDAAKTLLTFDPLIGAPVTGEYSIGQPSGLKSAGGNRLAGMGTQDSLVFQVTPRFDASTIGPIKVSGMVTGTDAISLVEVSDNTLDGGGGSFEVQTRSVFDMVSIAPEQTTATAGQTKKYQIAIGLENTGGSAVQLDLSPGNTRLIFQAGFDVGWAYTVQDTLLEGGTIVGGGETGTVILTVDTTGTRAEITSLRAFVPGIEINSGRIDDASTGLSLTAIDVQDPGVLAISSVAVSQPSVTEDTDKHWVVTARVSNTGEAELEIVPANLGLGIADNTAGTTVIDSPDEFETGGVSLPGGTFNRELKFDIIHTGTFSSLGPKGITVDVEAFEVNTDDPRSDTDNTGSVLVQSPPNLTYRPATLDPDSISRGAQAAFQLRIRNEGPNSATARLEPTTVFSISGTSYSAALVNATDSIPGGDSLTVSFAPGVVDIPEATYPVHVGLDYTHNGNDDSAGIDPTDSLLVQTPPDLSISSITPSQDEITADQNNPIQVVMQVQNSGDAPVSFDGASIRFILGGQDKTAEFSISSPSQFDGGQNLGGGGSATVTFTVQDNGSNPMSRGVMTIEGDLEVTDLNTSQPVTANTNTGGKGTLTVQAPAELQVVRVTMSQPTVTAGQTTGWTATVVVRNNGGSELGLDLTPQILTFDDGNANWSFALASGDSVLMGGDVDSLKFDVTLTSSNDGTRTIDALVIGTELNSLDTRQWDTSVDGNSGTITVQTPPDLIFATRAEAVAPNGTTLNRDQRFRVAVSLQNNGQAATNQVTYRIDARNGSSADDLDRTITALAGGGTVAVDTFWVTAADAVVNDTVATEITEAFDNNTGEAAALTNAARFDSVEVTIQNPAVLSVDSIFATQQTVTSDQGTDWSIFVYLSNTGGAVLELDPPSISDIHFAIGVTPQNDYVVIPPTQLGSGAPDWRIPGGASDSLRFVIDKTGGAVGPIDVRVDVAATDLNDLGLLNGNVQRDSLVTVEEPSGLFVESTVVRSPKYEPGGVLFVDTSWDFVVDVTVTNVGEAVESVQVSLAPADTTIPKLPRIHETGPSVQDIGRDEQKIFTFEVTAQDSSVAFQTLTAVIDYAISVNTSEPVTPSDGVDENVYVIVQTPARLTLTSFAITSPPNSNNTLSTEQPFEVTVRATNLGEGAIGTGGQLTLHQPNGFQFTQGDDSLKTLALDTDIVWHLTAPTDRRDLDSLICDISSVPNALNSGTAAATDVAQRIIEVTVLESGAFEIDPLWISTPSGARDSVVSTDQIFTVVMSVTPSEATVDVSATIEVPTGFQTVGPSTKDLNDGDGVTAQVDSFRVQAPPNAVSGSQIRVVVSGTDKNTSQSVQGTSGWLPVTAVEKANLTITASIAGPPEALDSTVTIGSTFQLKVKVMNLGTADIDTLSSTPTVSIVAPSGYLPPTGDWADVSPRTFRIDQDVVWDVVAPGLASGPDAFTLRIENIPNDENSGAAVAVDVRSQSIPMITEGASVAVTDVTQDEGIDNKVVPGGAVDVDKFAVSLQYLASDPSASDARVDRVLVTVLDKDGNALNDGALRGTLSSVYVRIDGERAVTNNPMSNPVVIDMSPTNARFIAPDRSITLTVGVSVKSNPSKDEFSLALRSGSLDVKDSGSEQQLGVVDATTGQGIGNKFESSPLVVLSSEFAEYVHNYPNPFQAGAQQTSIAYFLDQAGDVSIMIYDLTGTLVYKREIASGQTGADAGPQEVQWDGRNMQGEVVRNGVYVCVLSAGAKSTKFRIAVAK